VIVLLPELVPPRQELMPARTMRMPSMNEKILIFP
jgi:hypothetical protein